MINPNCGFCSGKGRLNLAGPSVPDYIPRYNGLNDQCLCPVCFKEEWEQAEESAGIRTVKMTEGDYESWLEYQSLKGY